MRWCVLLVLTLLLAAPMAAAQAPHPHDQLVHHPLTIEAEMRDIQAIRPEFIDMRSFGTSVTGFDLWLLDFVHPDAPDDVPVYYLDANHHGNEQLGMEALLIFMEELAEWSTTGEGAERLSEVRVVAVPMVNPDGTGTDRRVNNNGVDLNRNYDYNWGLYGTSDTPNWATGTYRGDAPLSEPETAANAALMREIQPEVYLSMHTGSHDIVLPWRQYDSDGEPLDGPIPDWPVYERFLAGIEDVSGLGYRDPSGAGESISYAYGALGAVSLIVEVDTTQNQLFIQQQLTDLLKEEVTIYWYGLEVFERLGGYLVHGGPHVFNAGWGDATNVTFLAQDGTVLETVASLPPGAEQTVPAGAATATYERRIQGDLHTAVWSLDVASDAHLHEDPDEREAPVPVLAALAALAAAFLVRRR